MFAWQATVQNEVGKVVFNPVVTVYLEDGTTLADIYSEDGDALDNPLTGTPEGFVQFWAEAGEYKIQGASGANKTEIWEVNLGGQVVFRDAAGFFEAKVLPLGQRVTSKDGLAWDIVSAGGGDFNHPVTGQGVNLVAINGVVSAKSFGLKGDGTIETELIKRALEYQGAKVHFTNGVYASNIPVEVNANYVNFSCDKLVSFDFSSMPASATLGEKYAMRFLGSKGAGVSLSANTLKGSSVITVASTSGFSKGDIVELKSSAPFTTGAVSGVDSLRGWISKVSFVSLTSITLDSGVYEDLNVSDFATISKVSPVSVNIDSPTIIGGGLNKGHGGIQIMYGYKPNIKNPIIRGCENIGVGFKNCYKPYISKYDIADCTSTPSLGNSGYGVAFLDGTVFGVARDGISVNCRHSVSGGGSLPTYHCKVVRQISRDCGRATRDLDCHEPCFYWTFEECTSEAGTNGNGGIIIRGQFSKAVNCRVLNAVGAAYHIRYYGTNTVGQRGNEICGCYCENSRYGVYVDGQPECSIVDTRISGLVAYKSGLNGIYANYYSGLEINGGIIDGATIGTGNEGSCVRLFASSEGVSKGARISGVSMMNPFSAKPCIRMDGVYDTSISGGYMKNAVGGGVIGLACKGSFLHGVNVDLTAALWQGSSENTTISSNIGYITTTSTTDVVNMTSGTSLTGLVVVGNSVRGSYDRFLDTSSIDKIIVSQNYAPNSRSSATAIQTTGATTVVNTSNILA